MLTQTNPAPTTPQNDHRKKTMTSTLHPTEAPHSTTAATRTTAALSPSPDHLHARLQNPPGARSNLTVARAIPTTLKAEWIKLSSLRSNKAIAGLTFVVSTFVSWAVATYVTDLGTLTIAEVFTFSTVFTAVFAAVAGILIFSSEAEHGTLAPALTAQPARWVIALAKTIVAAGFGAVLGAVGLLAGLIGAWIAGLSMGVTAGIASTSAWAILFASMAAILGLGVGMVARHSTAAVSGLLVWWLVVENLFSAFLAERFLRFMPFMAGNMLASTGQTPDPAEVTELTLSTVENAAVFGGYTIAALVIGTTLLYRRDN